MRSANETHPHIVGCYGKGLTNSNGDDLADENNLIIANTQFHHKSQYIDMAIDKQEQTEL